MKNLFFSLLLLGAFDFSYAQVSLPERAALQAIFTALDGPNWTSQTDADPNNNWDFSGPVTNTWHGLTVNSGAVVALNMNQNNASGSLPSEIGNLISLRNLVLSNNNISGAIPVELTNLINLERLIFSGNQITAIDLSGNPNLRHLDISRNALSTIDVSSNGALEFFYCSSNALSSLDISNNPSLSDMFADNNSLTSVDLPNRAINFIHLHNNQLTEIDLSYQDSLEELIIRNNAISVLDFSNSNYLLSFDVSYNQLTELHLSDQHHLMGFNASHNQISTLTFSSLSSHIQGIDLSHNLLSEHSLVTRLLSYPTLERLNISNNLLRGTLPDTSSIPLTLFHFDNNSYQFGDLIIHQSSSSSIRDYSNAPQAKLDTEETRNIATGTNTTMVTHCSGSYNVYQWFKDDAPLIDGPDVSGSSTDTLTITNLTGSDSGTYHCEVTSSAISGLTLFRNDIILNVFVESCELRDRNALMALYNATDGPNWVNNTNWNSTAPLGTWYGVTTNSMGCVIELDMNVPTTNGTNGLVGTLPDELGDLLNLEYLDLSHENLSGPIPNTIGNLTELVVLDFEGSQLTGSIPTSIGNLGQLRILILSNNQLTGSLPDEMGNLSELEFLVANENQISGSLPTTLGHLPNLSIIWLNKNQLSGNIPDAFSNLTNLQQFHLYDNQMSGNLPDFWNNLVNLETLWLNRNEFTGPIPNSISQLPKLEQLCLNQNGFTGEIPASLANLNHLESLWLSNNPLSGNIPVELGDIETLTQLLIHTTEVTGILPPELGSLSNLEYLWIGESNLSGEIPESYSNLTNLIQLILDGNNLTGTLPTGFGLFTEIETLSLRNNHLEGPIPDYSSTPLNILYFDNNNFEFGDFENQFNYYDISLEYFIDNPQAKVNEVENLNVDMGSDIVLRTEVSGSQNHYRWFKDGVEIPETMDNPSLIISNTDPSDAGVYYCEITSDIVTDLILIRNDITITVVECIAPIADKPEDVNTCESYILPHLKTNNYYFSESNGEGIQIQAGETITNTQTLFVYTGTNGCSSEHSFVITIDPALCEAAIVANGILFPKFFTPNNDGVNDIWQANREADLSSGVVQIFDRYGKFIRQFDTTSNVGWDGTSQGRPLPASDYWFRAILHDGRSFNGHFTLKR